MLNVHLLVVPDMADISSSQPPKSAGRQAPPKAIGTPPDAEMTAFERRLDNLPSDRILPDSVKQKILDLFVIDSEQALKIVLGIQNAIIGSSMGSHDKGSKIGEIIEIVKEDKINSDAKLIADLIQVCTYDEASDPLSVATLISQGWAAPKIIAIQEASKSSDIVSLIKSRQQLDTLMADDLELVSVITKVCNRLGEIDSVIFDKKLFMDRLACITAITSKDDLNSLMFSLLEYSNPTKMVSTLGLS